MEYRRAYWDRTRQSGPRVPSRTGSIPLLAQTLPVLGVQNFAFFDFQTCDGHVNESVFAYTNRANGERALVLYNNAYQRARGCVRMSTAINAGSENQTRLAAFPGRPSN